jgi:hypothetical protein
MEIAILSLGAVVIMVVLVSLALSSFRLSRRLPEVPIVHPKVTSLEARRALLERAERELEFHAQWSERAR